MTDFVEDFVASFPDDTLRLSCACEGCATDRSLCAEYECMACGATDCPNGDMLHYHHDGCPSCD